jgi:RNase P/RNase MRP subunit POP5
MFLKSILKDKKRYLLFKVFSEEKISEKEIAIEIFKNSGVFYSKIDPKIKFEGEFGIIKTNPKAVNDLERILAVITEINKKKAHILPIYISGSLKKIKEKIKAEKEKEKKIEEK